MIDSLSNINVRIPEFIQTGESADLTCSFNLGGDDLYSVKWYKGRHEFYRFMPNERPKMKIFPVKGMKINVSTIEKDSNENADIKSPELSALILFTLHSYLN